MLWKGPNPTQNIASVSVRQGPLLRPSLADWRRDISPEGTRVIPRERYVSLLCPQIPETWKIKRFLFIPGPIFICSGSKFIELLLTIPGSSIIIVNRRFVWKLFVPGLKTHEWNRVTDWFRKNKKVTGLNIFKRMNVSRFLLKQCYRAIPHAIEFNYRPVKMFIFT